MSELRTVRCPTEDTDPGPLGPIVGCGFDFEVDPEDFDGAYDCPNCGMFFDPDHPNSQPQPGADPAVEANAYSDFLLAGDLEPDFVGYPEWMEADPNERE
jgi:hypothetical protein